MDQLELLGPENALSADYFLSILDTQLHPHIQSINNSPPPLKVIINFIKPFRNLSCERLQIIHLFGGPG